MANEQYFSESEQQDVESMNQNEPHKTDVTIHATNRHNGSQDENTIHESIETDTLADTSDARQLQWELLATTPAHKRGARMRHNKQDLAKDQYDQHRGHSKPLLRQPGKVYEPLFGAATQTQKAQSSTHRIPIEELNSQGTGSITPFLPTNTDDKPGIFNRLTSWLFTAPPADFQPSKTTLSPPQPHPETSSKPSAQQTLPQNPTQPSKPASSSSTNPLTTPTWNRNHYLLLDHHYTRVLHVTTKPLPPAYMTPWSSIPSPLRKLVGTKLMTTTTIGSGSETKDTHPATITEQWVRIAHCFVAEAKERGVPVLCDGQFVPVQSLRSSGLDVNVDMDMDMDDRLVLDAQWQAKEGQGYPVRDEATGRVKRVKQEWWGTEEGAWDVLGRVYSLWVRDEVMGMSVESVR